MLWGNQSSFSLSGNKHPSLNFGSSCRNGPICNHRVICISVETQFADFCFYSIPLVRWCNVHINQYQFCCEGERIHCQGCIGRFLFIDFYPATHTERWFLDSCWVPIKYSRVSQWRSVLKCLHKMVLQITFKVIQGVL